MATCPNCNASSRTDNDAMTVTTILNSKPLGEWSLAGAMPKTVAVACMKLECRCGWSILGFIDGEDFQGWPHTQTWPDERIQPWTCPKDQ